MSNYNSGSMSCITPQAENFLVFLLPARYIVVMAKYSHNRETEEEYIDLVPTLKNLYLDTDEFLNPIKEVEVEQLKRDGQ